MGLGTRMGGVDGPRFGEAVAAVPLLTVEGVHA